MKSNLEGLYNFEGGQVQEKREEKIVSKGKYTAVQAKIPKSK